jgi:hypothetical protein
VERTIIMVRKGNKLERIVYEEKPLCGRCGAGIVGVIPKWRDQKPMCRECAFELEQMAVKTGGGRIDIEEEKAPLTPEEKTRRIALISVFAVTVLLLLIRIYTIAPMLQDPKPLRLGVTATDSLTDKCIEQLWKLSRNLQDSKMPNILPLCPRSSRQYIVTELTDDTIISCPAPEEHGLAELTVSLSSPIPHAQAGDEQ